MTTVGPEFVKYSEVAIARPPEKAARVISGSVNGLRRSQDGETYVYKTNSGITLAILEPAPRREAGAFLRYRTT